MFDQDEEFYDEDELIKQKPKILTRKEIVEKKYTYQKCKKRDISDTSFFGLLCNKKSTNKLVSNYGLYSIILALNSIENEELRQKAIEDHKYIHRLYSTAVSSSNNLLSMLPPLKFKAHEDRQQIENIFGRLQVDHFVKEYVEDPLRAIIISAKLAKDKTNLNIVHAASPAKAEEYYEAYLKINEKLYNGEVTSVNKAIENLIELPDRPMKYTDYEAIKKGYAAIDRAKKFYEPKFKELFSDVLFIDS